MLKTAMKIREQAEREAALGIFVALKAYKLFKSYYRFMIGTTGEYGFNVQFASLAIEHDAFDILALLKKSFTQDFERCKKQFIPSLVKTFEISCGFLQQKLELLREVIDDISFCQAEQLLLNVKIKIEEETPERNLLLSSPNLVLDCCLLHELSYLCEK